MGYLTVTIVLGIASWVVFAVFNHLRSYHFNARWWGAFTLLVVIGIGLGAWTGTQLEYHPNSRSRVVGFPIPLVVFVLEGENWTDFVPTTPVQYGAVAANILAAVACVLVPLTIAARITVRRNARDPAQTG